VIYFIRDAAGSRIKIGTTIRLSERLKQLTCESGDELEVLAVLSGSYEEESRLHQQFAHLRTVGEWFEPGDDLIGFIVSNGKPWDGMDEMSGRKSIKFDQALARKARMISEGMNISMAEYLSEMCRPLIDRDYAKLMRKLEGGE
jgi:hypothetical protein